MRLTFLTLACCLACDSGAAKVVVVPSGTEAVSTAPASAAPSSPPAAPDTPSGASEPRSEGLPGCRFQRPEVWAGGQVKWLGECQNGFAEGSGVIVNVVEGAEPERFYGHLHSGSPSVGVLQTDNGFVAGRWNNGTVIAAVDDVAQRNVIIDAFRAAASAATTVSKSFTKNADAESRHFYAQQARLLRNQMD